MLWSRQHSGLKNHPNFNFKQGWKYHQTSIFYRKLSRGKINEGEMISGCFDAATFQEIRMAIF
jgi:hypothetical protein